MALSFDDIGSFFGDFGSVLGPAAAFGLSFLAPDRESPDMRAFRQAEERRQQNIQNMINPPADAIAREEEAIRSHRIKNANELMAQLRRANRRGNRRPSIDRERIDDLGKFIQTSGPAGRDVARGVFAKAAGFTPNSNLALLGQRTREGQRNDFLNRANLGINMTSNLLDTIRQNQRSPSTQFRGFTGGWDEPEMYGYGGVERFF